MTKPNSEAIASHNLLRQGFEPYWPRFLLKRPNKPPVIRPLFPRYMFVLIDQAWYSVKGTRGVSTVLLGDDGPCYLSADVIADLKGRENKAGLVQLAPKPKFLNGTAVKTNSGPFAGHPMLYDGMIARDRVKVLVELMGRKVSIEIDEKTLLAA